MVNILSCNTTLGTCCSDAGLVSIINVINSIVEIIQVIVPVILIVSASIQLTTMMMNPDDPKEIKKRTLYNKFIAAVIVFLLPVVVNLVLLATAEGIKGAKNVEVMACFNAAKRNKVDTSAVTPYKQRSTSNKKVKVINQKKFDTGYTGVSITGASGGSASAQNYLASLNKMSNYVKNDKSHNWFYRWQGSARTFQQAVSTGTTNVTCVVVPNWALRDIGVTKPNQMAYQNEEAGMKLSFSNGAREAIEKQAKIYHFSTPLKLSSIKSQIGLVPGDIIFWKFGHTNVYAGTNSSGKMLFYDTGRGGDGAYKSGTFYFNSFGPVARSYGETVSDLIRLNK